MIPVIDEILKLVDKGLDFIPNPKDKADARLKIQQELDQHSERLLASLSAVDSAQAATNTEEAKSTNWFVAGWRPFIGWTCGAAFAWAFVVQPILIFILVVVGRPIPSLPVIAIGEMMPVLLGMLGLAGMRSWEKSQDVHNEH